MSGSKGFSCQFWSASKQLWVLDLHHKFKELQSAVAHGKKEYTEFRVIEYGAVRYTRIYKGGVLIESGGNSELLERDKGSTLELPLARRAKKHSRDRKMDASSLSNISSELGGIDIVLSQIQYTVKILQYNELVQDLIRQRSLLRSQIKRLDHITYNREVYDDVLDSS